MKICHTIKKKRIAVQYIHSMFGKDKAQRTGKGQRGQTESVQTVINFDFIYCPVSHHRS